MDRNEDGRASLIRLYNHGWKLNLGSALALLCGTAVVFVVYANVVPEVLAPWAFLVVLLLMAGNATFMIHSIRCPWCRLSLPWHAISTRPATEWQRWLVHCQICPQCGFSATGQG